MINSRMPAYVVERVGSLLNDRKKCLQDAKVCLIGVTYKRDVADIRESPALDIIGLLNQKGAQVTYHDPYIPFFNHLGRDWSSQPLDSWMLQQQDCVLIVADHSCLDYQAIIQHSDLVFDTRNATGDLRNGHTNVAVL